jgi:hypothetical protein
MKIRLVFDDWRRYNEASKQQESVYSTEEGVELSHADFHSGTTFDAEIELDEDSAKDLKEALASGAVPVFYAIPAPPGGDSGRG